LFSVKLKVLTININDVPGDPHVPPVPVERFTINSTNENLSST
jgi:hypothetical protein